VFSKNDGYSLISDDPTLLANKREWLSKISKSIKYEEKPVVPAKIVTEYYNISQRYQWYRLLVILALISSLYILRYEDVLFLAPITLFLANGLLLVLMRLATPRYLATLDILLILQIALGLSFWTHRHFHGIRRLVNSKVNT
jgi:hypothetical protein